MTHAELRSLREQASLDVRTGISHAEQGRPQQALGHFGKAVSSLARPRWQEDPASAWILSAAWINGSDALRDLHPPNAESAVIEALDHGIEALRWVPWENQPAVPERLILAWLKRATAHGNAGRWQAALEDFDRAGALLEEGGADATAERRLLSAMRSANRARVLLDRGEILPAWCDAQDAVAAFRRMEGSSGTASAAALHARAIHCRALAHLLDQPGGLGLVEDWIEEATESVEEALALAKCLGLTEAWSGDLVRYGATIYRVCQPQFLGEFLTGWLTGDSPFAGHESLRREMRHELLLAQYELERRVLKRPHDSRFVEQQIRILQSLQGAMVQLT